MQHVVGLWGHISHAEREMEAPEHQKGPCDQPQFDHLWVREMMAHLRHKRRIEGRRGLCQLARERQGRLFLGGARRRARQLRAEFLIECLRLLRRLASVLSPVARIQRRDLAGAELL